MEEPDTRTLIEMELKRALHQARNGREGLSIEEVAQIIAENFDESELRALIANLNGIYDNRDRHFGLSGKEKNELRAKLKKVVES